MASTLPLQPSVTSSPFLVKHRPPPPLLPLLLLLSLFLALALLHIIDFLTHTLSNPPLFHVLIPPLLLDYKQGFPSSLLHIQQHYLGSLLSPCPIFILANFIIFTLFLKSFYLSSSSSSSFSSDFSDYTPEKSKHGGGSLPEHILSSSHEDIFLSSPCQHYVLSSDSPEECLFSTTEDSTYFANVQSYNKVSNKWENVRGMSMDPYIMSTNVKLSGAAAPKKARRRDKGMMMENVQSTLGVAAKAEQAPSLAPAYIMLCAEQGKAVEKSKEYLQSDAKTSGSVNAGAYDSQGSQMVDINMEPHPARYIEVSKIPPLPLAPSQQPTKVTPLPPNTSTASAQRPPSSPKVKKSMHSGGFLLTTNDGKHEASKPLLDGEKQTTKKPQKRLNPQSRMVRSYSDQQLTQQALSTEGTTTLNSSSSSSSLIKGPHMQRARSLRSSTSAIVASSSQVVKRSPSFSEYLDGLSDAEANKCFSDFIAHRFALMRKELDVHST